MFRARLYARAPTLDQQTLPMQMCAMREYANKRGWTIPVQVKEVGSGAVDRSPKNPDLPKDLEETTLTMKSSPLG